MKNLQLLAPIAALICAAIVCGAVLLWAPVCSGTLELANGNMVPMRCAYTAKVELLLALILAAVAVAALVTKRPMTCLLYTSIRPISCPTRTPAPSPTSSSRWMRPWLKSRTTPWSRTARRNFP